MPNRALVRRRVRRPHSKSVRLPDGARVIIRPIRAADGAAFARAYTRLSELSRQRRFLSVAPTLRPADLRYLTAVDGHEHVALVAVGPDSEEILGSARYFRLPTRLGTAEMAIEVIDEWQRRGVGRALLRALSEHARASGIGQFVALVAADNVPMQRMLRRADATPTTVDSELEFVLDAVSLEQAMRHRSPSRKDLRHDAEPARHTLAWNPV